MSVASDGSQANAASLSVGGAAISANGRWVTFFSGATNLVPGDTNGVDDIFVHDLVAGTTTRVSVSSTGAQSNDNSDDPAISADGRFVVFDSRATNLVPGPANSFGDVFLHDMVTGETSRVSVSESGGLANSICGPATISADGRYVAFNSFASNLVSTPTNNETQAYVYDRVTGQNARVSVSSAGEVQNRTLVATPSISGDGRYVEFWTDATNLAPGGTNVQYHVYVHDLVTQQTTQVDLQPDGTPFDIGMDANLSADGSVVAFQGTVGSAAGSYERIIPLGLTFEVLAGSDYPSPSLLGLRVASNTLPGGQIAVTDVIGDQTFLASVNDMEEPGNEVSSEPSAMAADGSAVAFSSFATNLVPGDTNGVEDVFVRTLCGG